MLTPKPVDELDRWELAALWLFCIHADPQLFAPHHTEAPPLVAISQLERRAKAGEFEADGGPSGAVISDGHG
jgi:hypothetical protein